MISNNFLNKIFTQDREIPLLMIYCGMDKLTEQEIHAEERRRVGRPELANKLIHKKFGLYEDEWEYLRQWQSESGTEGENFGNAVRRLIEFARDFAPGGPMVEKPRDAQGRFLPENGTSKMAICRRKRREKREREEAGT